MQSIAITQASNSVGGDMEFYNLKTKSKVNVRDNQVKKQRLTRDTSGGKKQTRYALIAEVDGMRMFRFVNQDTFNSVKAPELN
jgi:hypothetical protein